MGRGQGVHRGGGEEKEGGDIMSRIGNYRRGQKNEIWMLDSGEGNKTGNERNKEMKR